MLVEVFLLQFAFRSGTCFFQICDNCVEEFCYGACMKFRYEESKRKQKMGNTQNQMAFHQKVQLRRILKMKRSRYNFLNEHHFVILIDVLISTLSLIWNQCIITCSVTFHFDDGYSITNLHIGMSIKINVVLYLNRLMTKLPLQEYIIQENFISCKQFKSGIGH